MCIDPALWERAYLQGYCQHSNYRNLRPLLTETVPIAFYSTAPPPPHPDPRVDMDSNEPNAAAGAAPPGPKERFFFFCCSLEMVRRSSVVKSIELA